MQDLVLCWLAFGRANFTYPKRSSIKMGIDSGGTFAVIWRNRQLIGRLIVPIGELSSRLEIGCQLWAQLCKNRPMCAKESTTTTIVPIAELKLDVFPFSVAL
jgi:hypothetical protein